MFVDGTRERPLVEAGVVEVGGHRLLALVPVVGVTVAVSTVEPAIPMLVALTASAVVVEIGAGSAVTETVPCEVRNNVVPAYVAVSVSLPTASAGHFEAHVGTKRSVSTAKGHCSLVTPEAAGSSQTR